ncbi:HNH endonuclease signature motif containing protein [Paenibacillus sp. RRE4]|uniref:HNH endonuclease n=1 Tax=Paenibacillus sp. RRE4 TaxID=2962587 RepID=UPI002881241C|nr:HNH endonuclease signature motif containing protein [Paenibacillus sp. RRE4]MDT0123912.1 HNH endonuclease signature motif containing protein [Paenibacillus sp. RRE4]
MAHQTFWKPEKKVKEKKVSSFGRSKKDKKPVPEWKKDILAHHQSRPGSKERGDFPKEVIAQLIEESNGICECCKIAEATTTHHVYPRGRKGRGVKTNGLRLCWPCHDRIQTNEELLQFWISAFRDKYGDHFWFDEQDWEEYNRKQEARQKVEQEKRNREELFKPVKEVISSAAGRSLKAKEVRLIEMMDANQIAVFEALINDIVRVEEKHQVPFGYGHFDD